ncbi:hypothetical protein BKA70DRAFT_1418312 [Coprinopsis sp. MPI-PUGE-AT-0042]|nr:hypothetical protein BKA70DRAFT_1418312 [Coprinopsis sp. MPI-PUGE-AT-0042]
MNKTLEKWERRRQAALKERDKLAPDELTRQLDEIDEQIKHIQNLKATRMRDQIAARHHLEGETNSKYDWDLNKAKKPRDTIYALQKPREPGKPPMYETDTKKMVQTATEYHRKLQQTDTANWGTPRDSSHMNETVGILCSRLDDEERDTTGTPIQYAEVTQSLIDVPNDKATGLDGIPIELWKKLHYTFKESTAEGDDKPFDVIGTMQVVFNDIQEHGVSAGTGFTDGWMCPLFKKKDPTDIANYRPITILNVDYKIMTKALTNKLAKMDNRPDRPYTPGHEQVRNR